jgi:hypothetical protein
MLVFVAFSPLFLSDLPKKTDQYFILALLGEDGMTENYFIDDDPTIEVGDRISWIQYIRNRMGETKYIAIRVKLLNSTMSLPNSTFCIPSSAPVVYETRRVLLNGEIWENHFYWELQDVDQHNDIILIKKIIINGSPYQIDVRADKGSNFRFIFELWVYDKLSDNFLFGHVTDTKSSCVWNQIWFNVKSIN